MASLSEVKMMAKSLVSLHQSTARKLATELLSGSTLSQVIFIERTGDITLEFGPEIRLEVFNNSSGYEGWKFGTPSGLQVIGMGGGGTANAAASR